MNRRINAEHYKEEMRKVIVCYGLSPDNIYFVDVLPYKCSPFAPAQAHRIEKKIYFKCILDHDEIGASFHNMSAFGIPENKIIKLRRDDWLFLKHTLLHEICEILNPTWADIERDKWAFNEMSV